VKNLFLFCALLSCVYSATLNITPRQPLQGNSVKLELLTETAVKNASVVFHGKTIPLYLSAPNKYTTMLGTYMDWPTGDYTLTVSYKINNRLYDMPAIITLQNGRFDVETLVISQQKQEEGATDMTVLSKENVTLGTAFRAWKSGSYIDGTFVFPLQNAKTPVTSPYGVQRHYQNHRGQPLYSWAHRGVDYAAALNTPVYAAQNGIISVAEQMQVHGGTIVIDHGQGVLSIYNHLNKITVKKDQYVTKNALIGYSGNTGHTTGPHLHYGLSVHDVRVNPQEWFGKKW
jgi:murein DD-endopeptidase MepM/ murein hydrolase activator NlpD